MIRSLLIWVSQSDLERILAPIIPPVLVFFDPPISILAAVTVMSPATLGLVTDSQYTANNRFGLSVEFSDSVNCWFLFYSYTPPRPLEEIEVDIKAVEGDVLKLLQEVAG